MILSLENRLEAQGVPKDLAQQFEEVARGELGPIVLSAMLYRSSGQNEPLAVTLRWPGPAPDTYTVIEASDAEELRWNIRAFRNKTRVPMKVMRTSGGRELEFREITPWDDPFGRGRIWFVRDPTGHADFDVWLSPRALASVPPQAEPLERDFTPVEVDNAVVLAVEGVLVSRETSGERFRVAVSSSDLYRAAGLL